jgi:hypothetical protein
MGLLSNDIFVATSAVGHDTYEIGLGSACSENSRFKAEQFGGVIFQSVYRRVIAVDIIANFSFGHSLAHCSRRLGNCIASKIDSFHDFSSWLCPVEKSINTSFANYDSSLPALMWC